MSQRRSERLRRKRQATPGLTQPGSYSLFGNGYVVESEASFLPPADERRAGGVTPQSSRRIRYKDSPHVYEESAPLDEDGTPERRRGVVDRARVSLFDILSSAARKPVNNTWRVAQANRAERDGSAVVEDEVVDEPVRNLGDEFAEHRRAVTPVVVLVGLLVAGTVLLLGLDATVQSRVEGGRSAWAGIRESCGAATGGVPEAVRAFGGRAGSWVREMAGTVGWAARVYGKYLFRPAFAGREIAGDVMTRSEFESEILPDVLAQARRTAAQEAARLSGALRTPPRSEDFQAFVERYAGDKDLPADFALGSAGGRVLWSRPSVWAQYGRFARGYALALVGDGAVTPVAPRRAGMILRPDVLPGNCWAFDGASGSVAIRLGRPARVRSVTMEHTPRGSAFSVRAAPREFRLTGLAVGGAEVALGEFLFDAGAGHLQRFATAARDEVMRGVRLDVLGNHGAAHTAVYRFRVHGDEVPFDEL